MQVPSRGHGRVVSGDERRRTALPRRSTKGPLDADDIVIDDPLSESTPTLPSRPRSPSASPRPPHHRHAESRGIDDMPSKDFSFLQDPQAYHVLPVTSVPPAFLNAPHAPPVSSPIDTLLLSGHYRLAAIAAARNIVTSPPGDYETLLHLLHVRLACLCLLQEHALAAQEAKVLGDISSAFYRHPLTNTHIVPWDLRLLVVRLAALGYGEWRKGIMGYYELARECRESVLKATSNEEKTLWRARLRDCGIRVANVLVEMGDLDGAGRHLGTLASDGDQSREISLMETLVWLRVGDMASARRCLVRATNTAVDELVDGTLNALILLADSDYEGAATAFRGLHEQFPDDAMVAQNLAVCLLYTGRISNARTILTELVDESPPFHSLVLNLSTVYELCTEQNREKKVALAARLAGRREGGGVGWELSNAELKL